MLVTSQLPIQTTKFAIISFQRALVPPTLKKVPDRHPWPRATINLEPKIRAAEQNLILLHKRKQLFLSARLTSHHIFAYLSPRTICFSNVLYSTSFLESSRKLYVSLAYFLNPLNVKPSLRYKTNFSKNPNQRSTSCSVHNAW